MNYKGAETVRLVVWQTNADPLKIARCNLALKPCGSDDSDPSCGKISVKTTIFFTQCGQGGSQKKQLSNFYSNCPKFLHARTAAYNQVCKVLTASLQAFGRSSLVS